MRITPPTFQELTGHGELHIPGQPPVGVLYYILFLAPSEPPSSRQMDMAGAIHVATGHMMTLWDLERPLTPATHYSLALADGQEISVYLLSNSMAQFALYTFKCSAGDLVRLMRAGPPAGT